LRSYVEKLRDKIKQLQEENTLLRTEKYETVVKISKLESELESAKIRNENSRTKLETSVRSLTDENESLREQLSMQQADNEIMSCDFRLLKEKYDTQFNEILSLKSQLSNAFFSNKGGDTSISGVATSNADSRKPTALLLGTSNLNGIQPDKLSTSVDISKSTVHTLEEAYSTIEN
jgi:chromosome segregation ATPase